MSPKCHRDSQELYGLPRVTWTFKCHMGPGCERLVKGKTWMFTHKKSIKAQTAIAKYISKDLPLIAAWKPYLSDMNEGQLVFHTWPKSSLDSDWVRSEETLNLQGRDGQAQNSTKQGFGQAFSEQIPAKEQDIKTLKIKKICIKSM